uniref:Uncharacterized protein n=1 Tax=Cacopsylla melanoneura TaxID=428564 RepID=A0A8D9BGH1_9HEMI
MKPKYHYLLGNHPVPVLSRLFSTRRLLTNLNLKSRGFWSLNLLHLAFAKVAAFSLCVVDRSYSLFPTQVGSVFLANNFHIACTSSPFESRHNVSISSSLLRVSTIRLTFLPN